MRRLNGDLLENALAMRFLACNASFLPFISYTHSQLNVI